MPNFVPHSLLTVTYIFIHAADICGTPSMYSSLGYTDGLKVLTVHLKIYVSEEVSMRPTGEKLKGGGVRGREKCTLWEGRDTI